MDRFVCPRCGASNDLPAVLAGMKAMSCHVVPLRCSACGATSSILRTVGGYAGFFAAYAALFLVQFIVAAELWQPANMLPIIIVAAIVPMLILPPLWAHLFLRSPPDAEAERPGDLSMSRKLGYLAAGLAVALVAIVAGIVLHGVSVHLVPPSADSASSEVTELSAEALEWSCRTTGGEEITLAELRDEVVFFNVWATWCGPCVAEMPGIAALARSVGDRVRFLLVSQERPETVRAFAEERQLGLPFATSGQLPRELRTAGIPATFVLHRGRIVYHHVGMADWNEKGFRSWLLALQ
jgi:thiol-disulfide isomerase/thioredoxin